MKTFTTYSLCLLAALLSTSSCSTKSSDTEETLLIVDVQKKYPTKRIRLQDIAQVEYIALETPDEMLWSGWMNTVGDHHIMNANPQNGNVILFDRKGKGLKLINRQGNSGEEYGQYGDMMFDDENKQIFVNDLSNRKVFTYDLNGRFLRVIDHAEDKAYYSITNYDANTFLIYNQPYGDDSINSYLFVSKETGEVLEELIIPPTGKKLTTALMEGSGEDRVYILFMSYPVIPAGNKNFILTEISNDTIFGMNASKELRPLYVQTPSRQTMDPEQFLFLSKETKDYLFFHIIEKSFDREKMSGFPPRTIMYDKKEKAFYEPEVYNDDYSIDKKSTPNPMPVSPGNNLNIHLQVLNAFDLIESLENNELKGELKEIASRLEEEDNPVVMIATLK